jgi:hemerythrin superfamily protein
LPGDEKLSGVRATAPSPRGARAGGTGLAICSGLFQPNLQGESNMAKSKSGSGGRSQPLAIELLVSDHRTVDELFKRYEDEKESDEETKRGIAQRVCGELTVHAQVEEELFYPWLRENLEDDDMELVEEAAVEHQSAKDLIAQIESATEIDETYDAKVKVLGEYIKHHVEEEENEIFPKVREMKDELDELGQEMMARKVELMEELGLMAEDGEEGAEMPAGRRGRSDSRSAARNSR